MATSLIVSYTHGDKKGQKALPNISDTATNAELYNFARDLMALSTYSFAGVKKVVTTTLDEPTEANNNG